MGDRHGRNVVDLPPADLDDADMRRLDAAAEFAREVDRVAYDLRVREAARAKVAAESALRAAVES